ncbi:hypothetical protein [Paenibacillus alkalitolerans]|uniref:hypothetical protein n=1 Tax=Paenibacillus alkalitolerans TaxID=2799335 RepID=UPI0018F67E73|nr:hypothetical protein [Paenibacillus alkalitolerans]
MNKFGHIDMRVNSWEQVGEFYEKLLHELGFTNTYHSAQWKVFAAMPQKRDRQGDSLAVVIVCSCGNV